MWQTLLADAGRHAVLALAALTAAGLVALPLGTAAALVDRERAPILGLAAFGRTLPSIAVLMLLLPILGVGTAPAIAALVLLALPPLVINVDLAVRGVPAATLDAARGLGMSATQRFTRVTVPLALPVVLSGFRTASVEVIGSATLATFVGAGGLGDGIVRALQTDDSALLVWSCITVALLAFASELAFSKLADRADAA
jgi:osmoprotectant transport system permease protein